MTPITPHTERLARTLAVIDAVNRADSSTVEVDGAPVPLALAEGRTAYEWVERLRNGEAPDALFIAARGHHVRRWEIPRASYPRGRQGYLAWRTRLYDFHAEALTGLMREAGYPESEVEAMSRIVKKRDIKTDPDAQTYEDAVSLAFLELQFAPFAARTPRDTMIRALQRTWRKMSDGGREAALSLSLPSDLASLVDEALHGPTKVD